MKRRLLTLFIILIVSLLAFCACDKFFVSADPNEYTVTYETNGGSAVASAKVARGGLVTRPEDPTKAIDVFEGWFADEELTTPWNFETDKVVADTTLYAKWSHNCTGGTATCTKFAICTGCGEAYGSLDRNNHTVARDGKVNPTCSSTGLTEGAHCDACGEILKAQEEIAKLPHTPVTVPAVAPTCEKTGLTAGTKCSVCGDVIVAQEVVPVVAHTYDNDQDTHCNICNFERDVACLHTNTTTIPGYAATCTEPGLTDGQKCTNEKCGHDVVKQQPIDPLGHAWGDWNETLAPTYDTEGEERRDCTRAGCDEYETRPVAKLTREVTVYLVATELWDSDNARFAVYMWNDGGNHWVSMVPSCEKGVYTAVVPAGYTNVIFVRMAPNSSNEWANKWNQTNDLTVAYGGDNCYTIETTGSDQVKATGAWSVYTLGDHEYDDGVVTLEPTCSTVGEKTLTCNCGHTTTTEVPVDADAHKWNEGTVTTDPTCEEAGVRTLVCEHNAAHTKNVDEPALGHTDEEDSNNLCDRCGESLCENHDWTVATCTEPETCSACGTKRGNALGHNWSDATCKVLSTCGRCHETRGELADHTWGDWTVTTAPTYAAAGEKTRECSVCHDKETDTVAVLERKEEMTVYLIPNSNWTQANARFAVYMFEGEKYAWVSMTKTCDGKAYTAVIPVGYDNIIFVRMNPNNSENVWGENSSHKWNQTNDLVLPADGTNLYTVAEGAWDNGAGTWSTYASEGHKYNDGEVRLEPTCSAVGEMLYTCACGHTKTEEIPVDATKHAYDNGVVTTPATCTATGVKTYTCAHDATHTKTEILPELHHVDADKNNICDREDCKQPLCSDDSHIWSTPTCVDPKTCSACGAVEEVYGEHEYSEWIDEVPATLEAEGSLSHYHCDVCDKDFDANHKVLESIVIEKLLAIYLQTGPWNVDNAWFAVYMWNTTGDGWIKMTATTEKGLYMAVIPGDKTNVIFCRMNPAYDKLSWNDYKGTEDPKDDLIYVWNQTVDITLVEGKDLYTITGWGEYDEYGNQKSPVSVGNYAPHSCKLNKEVATDAYKATDATCTAKATYYYSCSCGEMSEETFEYGETLPHTYDQAVVSDKYKATDATCTAKATYYYSCSCGEKGTETFENGEMLAHTYNKEVATDEYKATDASCTEQATYYYSCSCGAKGTETFKTGETLAHTYDQKVVAEAHKADVATCKTEATYYYSCSCGANGTETFKHGDTLPHTYDSDSDTVCNECGFERDCLHPNKETIPGTPATCTQDGYKDGLKCSDCGEIIIARETIPAKGHSTGAEGDTVATCKTQAYCSVCKEYHGELNADNHESDEFTYTTNNDKTHNELHACCNTLVRENLTCESAENSHECTLCGATISECVDADNDNDHNCDVCGKAEVTAHVPGEATKENEVEVAYNQQGSYDLVVRCTECNETISTEHVEVNFVVYFEPNANWRADNARFAVYFFGNARTDGWVNMTDEDGDGIYEAEIKYGYTNLIFVRFNSKYTENAWNDEKVNITDRVWNQTADLELSEGVNCYRLPEGVWTENEPTGRWYNYPCTHNYSDATCTTAPTCEHCGKVEGVALGHSWSGEWMVKETPTASANGTKTRECSVCGTVEEALASKNTLYLKPNALWNEANARFAAYFFGNGEKWVDMTDTDGDGIYEVIAPAGYPNVIFCRMNPGATANNWDNKWGQTADLKVADGTLYTIKDGSWNEGSWTTNSHEHVYFPATCTVKMTCYYCGTTTGETLSHVDVDVKNHKCDVCGATTGDPHEAAEGTHNCAYCGEVASECVDENKNHACDVCEAPMGECKDENRDHKCDYGCDAVFGTCEDKDLDHDCDYGCDVVFGTCADTNKDHKCDYGCGQSYGTCEDKDLDHDCDYGCDKVYGTCVDANLDHKCDYGCDKVYGEHIDAGHDHKCDYGCSEQIGTHECSVPKNNESTHWNECAYCGDKANEAAHTFSFVGYVVVDNAPYAVYTCECHYTVNRTPETTELTVNNDEALLKAALEHGYSVVLGENITISDTINIKGYTVTINLNGFFIENNNAVDFINVNGEKSTICEVLYVTTGAKVTITGEGAMIASGNGAYIDVISAVDGGEVIIEGGRFISAGCTAVYATRGGNVTINGGYFEAEDSSFLLDINEGAATLGTIEVHGGTFVGFNPADNNSNGKHTSYVVGSSHSLAVGNTYVVSAHTYNNDAYRCDDCGANKCEHSYDAAVTAPTCTADGYTTYTCSICKDTYKANTVTALGHKDANTDHVCDNGCGTYQGTHADTNKDHNCEYGCSVKIGECVDSNKDHACDYGCEKTYGTCADTNKDHKCDYGCEKAYGTCEDKDLDHACDYGCDKVYGTHADTDNDHNCEYGCSEQIGTHEYTVPNKDETNHWNECAYCDDKANIEAHELTSNKNETHHWTACDCGYATEKLAHDHSATEYNTTHHWTKCDCGHTTEEVAHTLVGQKNDTHHWTACNCGYATEKIEHNYVDYKNEAHHWTECNCGDVQGKVEHTFSDWTQVENEDKHSRSCDCGYVETENCAGGEATCKDKAVCEVCKVAYGETEPHNYEGAEWVLSEEDDTKKVHKCTVCGNSETVDFVKDKNTLYAAPGKIYLKPNKDWLEYGPRFAAYFFGAGETWVDMTDTDGDGIYEVIAPAGYPNVIFCRMNPGTTANNWDANNMWGQTADLTVANGTLYTLKDGTWNQGSWSSPSHDHVYNLAEATCTSDKHCVLCGHVTVDTLSHAWGEISYEWTESNGTYTCTASRTCGTCTHTETATATVTHETTTAPTCEGTGVETYTATFTEDWATITTQTKEVTLDATGHNYGAATYEWADDYSTCTATRVCGNDETHVETATARATSVTVDATCEEDGKTTYTATFDKDWAEEQTEVVTITAAGHKNSDPVTENVKAATCEADGSHDVVVYCSVCKTHEISRTTQTDHKLGHDYDDGVVKTPATCTTDGVKTYTCQNDNSHTYTETIPASHVDTNEDYICDREGCGENICEHNWVAGEAVAPTCTADGYTPYTCSKCSSTKNDDVVKTEGHNYVAQVTAPTCTTGGYTTHTCSKCTDSYKDTETAASGHKGGTATCTEQATCATCSEKYGESLGHDLKDVGEKAATCTEDGYSAHKDCSRCDYTEGKTVVPAGHALTHHVANDVTCVANGNSEYWSCSACDKFFSDENATTEIEQDSWVIKTEGHDWATTWSYNNTNHWKACSKCTEKQNEGSHSCQNKENATHYWTECSCGYKTAEIAFTFVYLNPNANWKSDSARFAVYFFGNGETWVNMTDSNGDGVYEAKVPTDKSYPSLIFCRMNPGTTDNNWNNKWSQSSDLSMPTGVNNVYSIGYDQWDKGTGWWNSSAYIYIKPSTSWSTNKYAVYTWPDTSTNRWVTLTKDSTTGYYKVNLNELYSNIIFCCMNSTTNNWSNKKYQTGDLKVQTNGNNLYTISGQTGGSWSKI